MLHTAAKIHEKLCRSRKLSPKVLEHAGKNRNDENDHAGGNHKCKGQDNDRIRHGRLDLAPQPGSGFEKISNPLHGLRKLPALLPGTHHVHIEHVEYFWQLLETL